MRETDQQGYFHGKGSNQEMLYCTDVNWTSENDCTVRNNSYNRLYNHSSHGGGYIERFDDQTHSSTYWRYLGEGVPPLTEETFFWDLAGNC